MNNSISGLSSGYYKIDEMISGLRKGNLIMACARPGVGRRQFVLNLAYNLSCDKQSSGAIFSKTICCERILDYMISRANFEISLKRKLYETELDKYQEVYERINKASIYINDNSCITLSEIYSKCKKLKRTGKLDYVIIADDIQKLSFGKRYFYRLNKSVEQNLISLYLKLIAKELDIPIIIVSKLPRKIDFRHDHKLVLSDFSTMGNIDWWIDVVMYIYRDDYYTGDSSVKPGVADINILKNKNGDVGSLELAYIRRYNYFANLCARKKG